MRWVKLRKIVFLQHNSYFLRVPFSLSLCAEVAVGVGPVQQLLPAVAGRGLVGENHLTVPLLPAARPHRLTQWADWFSGGAPRHMWVTTSWPCCSWNKKALRRGDVNQICSPIPLELCVTGQQEQYLNCERSETIWEVQCKIKRKSNNKIKLASCNSLAFWAMM